jgi:DNA-binding NtrC family response regulator
MNPPRVLIVDDERLIRWSLQQKLEGSGYEAVAVESGEDALRSLDERTPDLVLLDVRLPGIDGLEVLRRIRSMDPSVVVVMLSAGDAVEQAIRCREEGAFDYLVKPFDLAEVLQVVDRALQTAIGARGRRPAGEQAEGPRGLDRILGRGESIVRARGEARRLAEIGADPVLIRGEPGTGKELFGRVLHESADAGSGPFLVVRCASLPDHLCEFELLGHERGRIGDGDGPHRGILEQADGGTVFLDEVGALRPTMQENLLGLLECRSFRRVGGETEVALGARIVAATAKDLERGVAAGWFDERLRSLLSEHTLELPPLRECREDLPGLVEHFAASFAVRYDRPVVTISPAAMRRLEQHRWPGNVKELRGVVERCILTTEGSTIGPADLPGGIGSRPAGSGPRPAPGGAEARWAL